MPNDNDISAELSAMNSPLAAIGRSMPFTAPSGYFDSFATQLKQQVVPDNSVVPFDVPENYFNNLPAEILSTIKQEERTSIPARKSFWQPMRWAAAAVLIIAIGLGTYRTIIPQSLNIQQELSEIPEATITNYIQEHIDEFDTEIIASNSTDLQPELANLNNTEIENYLESAGWQ